MGEKDHRQNKSSVSQPSDEVQSLLTLSNLLLTGLSASALTICLRLIELEVDPNTLAEIILELKKSVADKDNGQANSNAINLPYTRNG